MEENDSLGGAIAEHEIEAFAGVGGETRDFAVPAARDWVRCWGKSEPEDWRVVQGFA